MLEVNAAYANGNRLGEVPEHMNCGGYMGLNGDNPPVKTTKEAAATKPDLNAENPPKANAVKDFFVTNKKYFYVGVPIVAAFGAFAVYLNYKKGKKIIYNGNK